MKRTFVAIGIVVAVAFAVPTAATGATAAKRKLNGSITVLAASSLTEVLTKLGTTFEHEHPSTSVAFSFNATSTLVAQIQQGAPADVFASADQANMQELVDGGQVTDTPAVFARNQLAIAVRPGNPMRIKSLADTAKPGVTLVLCAPAVPCGKFALEAYGNAGVTVPAVPTAVNVKDALSKVILDEADAAVVYVTDVKAAKGDVTGVKIPNSQNVIASYPIAALKDSSNLPVARAFARYVRSSTAQRTLRQFGFLSP